ncbi:ABC-type uncharacterized transport system [Poriferisphaera corsica]|uniref:ABC-type uncharacterized transport system n=1 Tax=Poriferisphaera corsica TaxID=2528020 RepID=A0A517YTV8_9BACT|nr:Gldg family protein [Poriferisphaera corsica]QDU33639.1 ABC-type uncharacterized transport system [Poriferisphaera corsica]
MSNQDKTISTLSHRARRTRYTLILAVSIIAALTIIILINLIVDRGFRSLSEQASPATRYLRYDFTATRQYSLSPQTLKVLKSLDNDYRLITVINATTPQEQRVPELVNEYKLYTNKITVEQINPTSDVKAIADFYDQLEGRYTKHLGPITQTVADGQALVSSVVDQLNPVVEQLKELAQSPEVKPNRTLSQLFASIVLNFSQQLKATEDINGTITTNLSTPLPAYQSAKSAIVNRLLEFDSVILAETISAFDKLSRSRSTPPATADAMLKINKSLNIVRDEIRRDVTKLQKVQSYLPYEEVRAAIQAKGFVAILADDEARIIPVSKMYRELPAEYTAAAGEPELGFIGEEQLTGSLISMSFNPPPLVIFVQSDGQDAFGEKGMYNQVGARLRTSNIQLAQWNPIPANSMDTLPKIENAQHTVWVVPAFPALDVTNPQHATIQAARDRTAQLIKERIAKGDSALVMMALDPLKEIASQNPIIAYLNKSWGIYPENDRVILSEQVQGRDTFAGTRFKITEWPTSLPITQSIKGMSAAALISSPIKLDDVEGIKQFAIMQITSPRMWTYKDFTDSTSYRTAEFDPETASSHFIIGVAAEGSPKSEAVSEIENESTAITTDNAENNRIIVTSTYAWATDFITTNADPNLTSQGQNQADVFGAAFPANSDLFVNSIYWLSGNDDLIAASPRSQDLRRVGAMTENGIFYSRLFLIGGLPIFVFVLGIAVWSIRRRD